MTNKTKVSLLEAEIEKLSRRNAYRQQNDLHFYTIYRVC